jgi:hypothetical protein
MQHVDEENGVLQPVKRGMNGEGDDGRRVAVLENEWKKTKAMLEQRIDFLEQKLKEGIEREDNLKSINEQIMAAMAEISEDKNNMLVLATAAGIHGV